MFITVMFVSIDTYGNPICMENTVIVQAREGLLLWRSCWKKITRRLAATAFVTHAAPSIN
jgi:hypothetical protein